MLWPAQAGILANNLLQSCLLAEGYYKAESTLGLWHHKWRPIQFRLIIDDFGVDSWGWSMLSLNTSTMSVICNKFAGIDIKWDYGTCRCHISMPSYIKNLLIKFKHPCPTKPRLLPHKCLPITYGAKAQLTPTANTSEHLVVHCKCLIQEIVQLLLYYARVANNKLMVALSAIAACQSCATTMATKQGVHLLLDYVATYLSDSIIY
jgi:hypothetical protein